MTLVNAIVVLALVSSNPESAPPKPGGGTGCLTTNIETALRYLFEHHENGGPLELTRDSGEKTTPDFIAKSLKIRDVPNGYVTIEGPDLIESYEAAMFKNPEGYHLVLVSSGGSVSRHAVFRCDKSGMTVDEKALEVSTEEAIKLYADAGLLAGKGKKKGVDAQTLKDWGGTIVTFALPRKGRTIIIKADVDESGIYGKKLGTVEYVDSKFVVHSLAGKGSK